ncbi:hypothetical protein ACQP00_17255 [Dactylosporangium sp. CS-047395]|uniref:hypothetical protein n=1 Tax=Dactylosporangium sp. CS-047395 TaxID=3239936 RepID=UPI003D8F6427
MGSVLLAGLLLAAAGCEADHTAAPGGSASAKAPPLTQAWQRTDLKPAGQFTAVGGVAVGYVADAGRLQIVALDPATGKTLWGRAASPGEVALGTPVVVHVVDGKVAYFRADPKGNLFAQLVVADPRTGDDVAVTAPTLFGSPPLACSNGTDVCTTSRASYKDKATPHRLRMSDKQYVAENTGAPAGSRSVGSKGLTDLGTRDPEKVALIRDGKLVWQRNLGDAFPAGFTSDLGWSWSLYSQPKLYVGSVYGGETSSGAGGFTRDLAAGSATAALSEADGSVVWRDAGSALGCQGTVEVPVDPANPESESIPVRCRYKGTSTWSAASKSMSRSGLDVVVEGFDPATGKTTWSVPVGAAEELVTLTAGRALTGPGRLLVSGGTGPIVIDLTTGRTEKPAADATFWCGTRAEFEYGEAYYIDGKPEHQRIGGELGAPCGIDAKPADRVPSPESTRAFGTVLGADVLVAKSGGVIGYHQG